MTNLQQEAGDAASTSVRFGNGDTNEPSTHIELNHLSAVAILEVASAARRLVEALHPLVNELLSSDPILRQTVVLHDALHETEPLLSQLAELAGWTWPLEG